ncbi:MAG: oxygen-independent coproporphyrinogen III oxidase [Acidobacteriota bacterium]
MTESATPLSGFPNPEDVPPQLVAKYATRGPRYTSYPTAPQFQKNVDQGAMAARWQRGNGGNPKNLSLYFHIPFCRSRCWFCGCHVVIKRDPAVADPYVAALIEEMRLAGQLIDSQRPVRQIAYGGGTPTFLTPDQLERLLSSVARQWTIAADAEVSIEVDPRTVTPAHIGALVAHGVNRFSLGVQDFDEQILAMLHRPQSRDTTQRVVAQLRSHGCNAINFDLIYGLPGQTAETSARTVEATIEMRPSRIAFYHYAHVPWLKPHQKLVERRGLPDSALKLRIFGQAYRMLTAAGYVSVGMDHFALREDEMTRALQDRTLHRNFMGYTTRRGLDQLAFGVSGISSVSATYAQNVKELAAYYEAIGCGRLPWELGFLMSEDDCVRRELIIDLFCNFYLDTAAFGRRWNLDFGRAFESELASLRTFQDDGLVDLSGDAIEVTPVGRYFIRNICMVFDKYLEAESGTRTYSQTL